MPGPWEKYQSAQPGPWAKYQVSAPSGNTTSRNPADYPKGNLENIPDEQGAGERGWTKFKEYSPIGIAKAVWEASKEPPSALETGLSFGNPTGMRLAKGMFYDAPKQALSEAVEHIGTAKTGATAGQRTRAGIEALAAAGRAVPIVGPLVADVAGMAGAGNVAGLAGAGTGIAASALLPKAGKSAATVRRQVFTSPKNVRLEWAKNTANQLQELKATQKLKAQANYNKITGPGGTKPPIDTAAVAAILPEESALPGIKAARQKLGAGNTETLVRDARAELSTYLRNRNLTPDEFRTYRTAYGQLTGQLESAYKNIGKLPEFQFAEKQWGQYMRDFHSAKSPIRKALDQYDAATGEIETGPVINQLGRTDVGQAKLNRLRQGPQAPDLASEAARMAWAKKMGDTSLFSSPFSLYSLVPGMKEAMNYVATRPFLYKSLKQSRFQKGK